MTLGLLPALCFAFVLLTFRRRGLCWRTSFLSAALVLGVLVTAATELLSLLREINLVALLVLWTAATAAAALVFASTRDRSVPAQPVTVPRDVKWVIAGAGVILVLTAVTAAASAPSNWDSFTYRLARVMHWMQNQ